MTGFKKFFWIFPFLAVFFIGLQEIRGGDLLWHIRLGMFSGSKDIFSHTMLGAPLPPHGPLFQWIVGKIHLICGWTGLLFFQALLHLLLFTFMFLYARKFGEMSLTKLYLLLGIFWIGNPQLHLHPQIFFFIFFVMLVWLGTHYILGSGIVTLWPWLHPSFPIGIFLLMIIGWPGIFSALAASGLIYMMKSEFFHNVFAHAESPVMLENVGYWKPIWAVNVESFQSVSIFFLLILLILFAFRYLLTAPLSRPERVRSIALAVLSLALSLLALRFFPLIPLIFGCWAIHVWPKRLEKWTVLGFVLLSFTILMRSPDVSFGKALDERELPVDCTQFMKTHDLHGNLFNSYSFGGYVIYALGERHKVFIDPRSSQIYPDEFLKEFLDSYENQEVFEKLVQKYHVGHTMLKAPSPRTEKLIEYLDHQANWKRVYSDSLCVIHEKKPGGL